MIKSFRDRRTAALFEGKPGKGIPSDVARVARRKLRQIDAAEALAELKSPPGNRLEAHKKDRIGQHSIRVNDQWRICFVWRGGAEDVEFTDYH